MSVRMKANKGFTNPRVKGPREGGVILPGDAFETDWLHGRELRQLGLADPQDERAFDEEPAEAVQPHHTISEPELRRVNARRRDARDARYAAEDQDRRRRFDARSAVTGFEASSPTDPSDDKSTSDVAGDGLAPPAAASTVKTNVPPVPPAPGT